MGLQDKLKYITPYYELKEISPARLQELLEKEKKYDELVKEGYEEPKDDATRVITSFIHYVEEADDTFYCDKSVKKLVEKLKAWKRLEEAGFRFIGYELICGECYFEYDLKGKSEEETYKDLDLLFGGEE